ncbi:MAG TPA: prepilin-type N-terminal cleavage/methylation domain-containing protein [Gemmatimonadaceae bacterium]|jgi:prepilin-type N-terminal cleavage/methylation domain-containing protein|nr:prepilin-type N-terminal cleavage/methylation domain-containing protein [Gemmatimonadaceae bacterium]
MRIRSRPGLTLVEVIVAMLLFSTGALGLAATSAFVARQISVNNLRSRASFAARNRSESAIAAGCADLSSGSETKDGIKSDWTVIGGTVATLDQTVQRAGQGGVRTDRVQSSVLCR